MLHITTLAAFKRFLKIHGATVQVTRNDWMDKTKTAYAILPTPGYFDPKTVAKVTSVDVQFSTGSWFKFPAAAHMRFRDDSVDICMQQDGTFSQVLTYKFWVAE